MGELANVGARVSNRDMAVAPVKHIVKLQPFRASTYETNVYHNHAHLNL